MYILIRLLPVKGLISGSTDKKEEKKGGIIMAMNALRALFLGKPELFRGWISVEEAKKEGLIKVISVQDEDYSQPKVEPEVWSHHYNDLAKADKIISCSYEGECATASFLTCMLTFSIVRTSSIH